MVLSFYSAITGETAKLKSDASVFTIADGIVQHLLINHLFAGDKFRNIVGEEDDCSVNIATRPYTVDDLTVPEDFFDMIENVRSSVTALSAEIDAEKYRDLTIFIDPIDGTREFSTGLGEQCSICIGFADETGIPVAGIVYRPIMQPPTWAAGAKSEGCVMGELDRPAEPNQKGLLTSNGGISPFIAQLITELGFVRVPSGGAGNKMYVRT
jgi:3'-phosphoadenosine 5'-phosphosulfate (PAPS) 3'-phosphatase